MARTLDKLTALGTMPNGVEIYNGHYGIPRMVARGRRCCFTAFWDRLLSAGHRLWGFASDDFHDPDDFVSELYDFEWLVRTGGDQIIPESMPPAVLPTEPESVPDDVLPSSGPDSDNDHALRE